MEKSALAQEKIWFDKPSYDKAERLYFELKAKVVPHKIMESCSFKSENSVTNDYESILNHNSPQSKTKLKETKDNKLITSENVLNDTLKNHKTNKYENEYNTQENEDMQEKQKSENIKNNVKKYVTFSNDVSMKNNTEAVKEKKNKRETRHRNKQKEKSNVMEQCEQNQQNQHYQPPHVPKKLQWIQENQQTTPNFSAGGSLAIEVAKAHQYIKESLQYVDNIAVVTGLINPSENVKDNLDGVIEGLRSAINNLEKRVNALENDFSKISKESFDPPPKEREEKQEKQEKEEKSNDDDEIDLFGSDSEGEDAEIARIREEGLAAYAAKKSKKPAVVAKSNIILDVKPWDSEVDMNKIEAEVRAIQADGLLWGPAKLVPLVYGIFKLRISCVVEDEKVSVDWLTDEIQNIENYVQSVDIAAFNKV